MTMTASQVWSLAALLNMHVVSEDHAAAVDSDMQYASSSCPGCTACAEALRSDVQLLESGLNEGGRAKALVPKALDADDEDDPGPSDDDDSDEEVWGIEVI